MRKQGQAIISEKKKEKEEGEEADEDEKHRSVVSTVAYLHFCIIDIVNYVKSAEKRDCTQSQRYR